MSNADALFAPFRGLLYRDGIEARTAPPYDVMDADEAAAFRRMDPCNIVHVDLPVDLGDTEAGTAGSMAGDDADGAVRDAHRHAASLLESWTARGVMAPDPDPSFYLYRQGYSDSAGRPGQTTGIVGALAIGDEHVLPHEHTTEKASSDRLVSLQETRTNLSMIIGLSLAQGLGHLLEPEGPPVLAVTDEDGVHHRLWQITSPAKLSTIADLIGSAPVVIADGHHRYSVAARYRAELGRSAPSASGRIMAFVVPLDPEFLVVRPIHRIVARLGVPASELPARLGRIADVEVVAREEIADAAVPDAVTLVVADAAYRLHPRLRDADRARLAAEPECLAHLAVVWVHSVLLPEVGAEEVVFHHSPATALTRVSEGTATGAVLVPPVSVHEIGAVARAGQRMPPKTTFFWPKARTGLVLRRFADQA